MDFYREHLNDYPLTTWKATYHSNEVEMGDTAFVWKAQYTDDWRGIIAREIVCLEPSREIKVLPHEISYFKNLKGKKDIETKLLFRCKTERPFPDTPLKEERIKANTILKDLTILTMCRHGIYKLSQEHGEIIDKWVNNI